MAKRALIAWSRLDLLRLSVSLLLHVIVIVAGVRVIVQLTDDGGPLAIVGAIVVAALVVFALLRTAGMTYVLIKRPGLSDS